MSRSILITGCSSGIGYDVAHGLHQRGYRVFATARQADDVKKLADEGLESLALDLNSSESIHDAVSEVLERTGGALDALFNNGAFGLPGAVEDIPRAGLEAQFQTNLFGTHELTCRVIPVMRKQGRGRIIQNSSVLGIAAFPYRGAYVASKFAMEGLTDTLRMELHGSGIHVSLIEPGPITSRFRINARKAFRQFIDAERSVHREAYAAAEARMSRQGKTRFELGPDAVLKKVIHALESQRPRPRYYVTTPTYLFGGLRRVLSTRAMDTVLRKASGGGAR